MFNSDKRPSSTKITPVKFYQIVQIMREIESDSHQASEIAKKYLSISKDVEDETELLAKANNAMLHEVKLSALGKNRFKPLEDQAMDFADFAHTLDGANFLRVVFTVIDQINMGYHNILTLANGIVPQPLMVTKKAWGGLPDTADGIQHMMYEMQLNESATEQFVSAILALEEASLGVHRLANNIVIILDSYFQALMKRHTVDGVAIQRDPIITDIATSIYENIDAHGEIESGKSADEVSAYSVRKAEIVAKALKNGPIAKFIAKPSSFLEWTEKHLKQIWDAVEELNSYYKKYINTTTTTLGLKPSKKVDVNQFMWTVDDLHGLDPTTIVQKDKAVLLTSEERFNLAFRNETLKHIVGLLTDESKSASNIVQYVLGRKQQLRKFFQDENSFYVCKIGGGNAFLGDAPGALQVIPGQRPNVNLDEIIGSGFAEIKHFMKTIEAASKWHDLFVATSPSKTADKSNVLMIGPVGCGKSEILRAVGSDKKSIGVFAQGSDFLTCWKGEAEKNPKRLFEAGLKLQKDSGRHVHFLIDEIDSILNNDKDSRDSNLTLEFQILMDGVVQYPNLSVWGATNNPERIPMAMIRRFSKVVICGELDQANRITLLKQFVNYLPTDNFTDDKWNSLAERLDGATGDVMRKIADYIWRNKISELVTAKPEAAMKLIDHLNKNEKFQIANFDSKERHNFKNLLKEHGVVVNPSDVDESITLHLANIAIRSEIETAINTYDKAKAFLGNVKANVIH